MCVYVCVLVCVCLQVCATQLAVCYLSVSGEETIVAVAERIQCGGGGGKQEHQMGRTGLDQPTAVCLFKKFLLAPIPE